MDLHPVTAVVSSVPTDWLIIGCLLVLLCAGTLLAGSNYATALALALPVATFLYNSASQTFILDKVVTQFSSPIAQAAVFGVFLVLIGACIYFMIANVLNSSVFPLRGILIGVATTALIMVFWINTPPLDALWHFGSLFHTIFGPAYLLPSLLAAYIALAFSRT